MKRIQIKFCGFKTEEEVDEAVQLPIDAMGFILVPGRKRSISKERLYHLIKRVKESIWTVGVFQNTPLSELMELTSQVPIKAVQLHGDESPFYCQMLKKHFPSVHVIKVFHTMDEIKNRHLLSAYAPWIDVALLDAATPQIQGGTGQAFAWELIPPFLKTCQQEKLPLWIAGGLHEGNVTKLLTKYDVHGIDVSSGIETDGRKDPERMKRLIRMVKQDECG